MVWYGTEQQVDLYGIVHEFPMYGWLWSLIHKLAKINCGWLWSSTHKLAKIGSDTNVINSHVYT